MRVQKWLSNAGYCSRRAAEELIRKRKITIDRKIATLGDRITEGQEVRVNGEVVTISNTDKILILYHKPVGVECTMKKIAGVTTLADIDFGVGRVFNIGRLDRDSRGLLLLTNDGRLCQALSHPGNNHEKVYTVTVNKPVTERLLKVFQQGGVSIGGKKTRPAKVKKLGENIIEVTLQEGRNRQIRHTCIAAGHTVTDLFRTEFSGYRLGDLVAGEHKIQILPKEMNNL